MFLFLLTIVLSICLSKSADITGWVYVDNWFQLYFNGEKVAQDPITFKPHNAVKISFSAPDSGLYSYALWAQDFADDVTGLEDRNGGTCLGDGGIRISLSDGTVSNSSWKCFITMQGPSNTECVVDNECTNDPDACTVQYNEYPSCWNETVCTEADSWSSAVEYDNVDGWGVPTPAEDCCGLDYAGNDCDTQYPNGCNPSQVDWTEYGDVSFIWTGDLNLHNRIICRYSYCAGGGSDCSAVTDPTKAPTDVPSRSPLAAGVTYDPTTSPTNAPNDPTRAPSETVDGSGLPTEAPVTLATQDDDATKLYTFIAFGIALINIMYI